MGRASHDPALISIVADHRQTEVGQLGYIIAGHQDVGWLDIAMDHALVVRVVKRFGHLG